jgi:hypothetical protein
MKKRIKIVKKLIRKVGGSLPLLKNGTKRSVILIAADKIGLTTISRSKSLSDLSLLRLNFTIFLKGVDYEDDIYKNIPRNYDNG